MLKQQTSACLFILLLALPQVGPARAKAEEDLFAGFAKADTQTLSELRGAFIGFAGSQRLELSFGIEQAVSVNNNLLVTTKLTVPSINDVSAARSQITSASSPPLTGLSADPQVSVSTVQHAGGQLSLVQIGPGNSVGLSPSQLPSGVLNIIQNTLDNQVIAQSTALNVTVNSVGIMRMMNLHSTLQQQLGAALR
jgi:hypothetical protein